MVYPDYLCSTEADLPRSVDSGAIRDPLLAEIAESTVRNLFLLLYLCVALLHPMCHVLGCSLGLVEWSSEGN